MRLAAGQIVAPGAGVRVDDAEGGILFAQMQKHTREQRVFEDVGKISGVEGVAIVQGAVFCLSMIFSENRFPPRIKSGAGFFGIML